MRGQLSAEMLILIVVVLAVVALVASQLLKTGEETSKTIDKRSGEIINSTESAFKKKAGSSCSEDDQCESNYCISGECR